MAPEISIQIFGADRLAAWLVRAPLEFDAALYAGTAQGVALAAAAIRSDTPVRSGALMSSIGSSVRKTGDGAQGEVYSTSHHARFVEFGTRKHGRAQRMFARGLQQVRQPITAGFQASVGKVADFG